VFAALGKKYMQIEASIVAAWWGAIVASIVLLWDIFKWLNRGAKVIVNATGNMQTVNRELGKLDENNIIFLEANNIGDLPTTITHLVFYQYRSWLHKLFNKPKGQGLVPYQGTGCELPHLLNPGARWTGQIDQDEVIEKFSGDGIFYCGILHTLRKKPVVTRVVL
jgi:hypothetical protein